MIYSLKKTIAVEADCGEVFDALTIPAQILQYYPVKSVDSELKEQGDFILKGEVNGSPFTDYGLIEVFNKPKEFAYLYWSDNHGTDKVDENYMRIRYTIEKLENGSQLTLSHENLLTENRHREMMAVWDFLLAELKKFVERVDG